MDLELSTEEPWHRSLDYRELLEGGSLGREELGIQGALGQNLQWIGKKKGLSRRQSVIEGHFEE